jgi:hypothetical protein
MRSTASLLRVEFLGQSPWHDRDYEESALTKVQMKSAGTPAGDGVFILGVPMGINGQQRNYVSFDKVRLLAFQSFLKVARPRFLLMHSSSQQQRWTCPRWRLSAAYRQTTNQH